MARKQLGVAPSNPLDGVPLGFVGPTVTSVTNQAAPSVPVLGPYVVLNNTGLAQAVTGVTMGGTPADGYRALLRFKDNGTPQNITLGTTYFRPMVTVPAATTAGKWLVMLGVYNGPDAIWDIMAARSQP